MQIWMIKMNIWFTSDTHFGHKNIIKYSKRPFKDLYHMDSTLIKNFNERIKPEDTVYFLGDFCFRNTKGGKPGEGTLNKAKYYREQLNGNWIFVRGNHDHSNSLKTHIESILLRYGGEEINLCHKPEDADPYIKFNFTGHVHELNEIQKITENSYSINVGVDVWKYRPVSFDEIMKRFTKWIENMKPIKKDIKTDIQKH